jgi:hypothetical protein
MNSVSAKPYLFIRPAIEIRPKANVETSSAVQRVIHSLSNSSLGNLVHIGSQAGLRAEDIPDKIAGSVFIGGKQAHVIRCLGFGGTKAVFDIEWEGNRLALGLPSTFKSGAKNTLSGHLSIFKWELVLYEPETTNKIRDLGLCTNNLAKIIPVTVGETEFPAIVMSRYEDLPYLVFDAKNPDSSPHRIAPYPPGELNERSFLGVISPAIDDMVTLCTNSNFSTSFGADSLNGCLDEDGKFRIYFNDLSNDLILAQKTIDYETALNLSRKIIDTWIASIPGEKTAIKEYCPGFTYKLDKDAEMNSALDCIQGKIAEQIMERAAKRAEV